MIKLKPEFRQKVNDGIVVVDDKTELPKQRFLQNFLSALSPQTSLLICHDFFTEDLVATVTTIVNEVRQYRHHMAIPFKKAYIICAKGIKQKFLSTSSSSSANHDLAIYNYRTFGHKLVECINANTVKQTFSDAIIILDKAHKVFNTNATTVLDKDMQLLATFLPHLFVNESDQKHEEEDDAKIKAYEELLKDKPDKQKRQEMHLLKLLKADKASNLNFLLFSPTPMSDVPQDIVPLLNLMLRNDQLSEIKVDDIFSTDGSLLDGGKDVLKAAMAGYVSYIHSVKPLIHYIYPDEFRPPMNVTDTAVKHLSLYNAATHQLNIREFMQKNASKSNYHYTYLPGKEEVFSIKHLPDYSPKIKQLLDCVGQGDGVILVFSKFLENGLIPIALALEQILGFDRANNPNLFLNKSRSKENNQKTYAFLTNDKVLTPKAGNRPRNVKVFLVSFSVADQHDLEFKNVRQIHILDPVPNLAKIDELLKTAKEDSIKNTKTNNIEIYLHCASTKTDTTVSADIELYATALQKAEKIGQVMRILKENAQDCVLQQQEQKEETDKNKDAKIVVDSSCYKDLSVTNSDRRPYAAVCDYMANCDYKCAKVVGDDMATIIKNCFRRSYVITRQELVLAVCAQLKKLTCSSADIFAAADHLIKEKTPVKDFYGKDGSIVLIGSLYFFQPIKK